MATYEGWKVGDYAIRKNRLCRITKIHFDEYPPHVTVQMLDDNNEIGTEFEKLRHATDEEIVSMQQPSNQMKTERKENSDVIINNNRETNDGDDNVGEKNHDNDNDNENNNNENENENENGRKNNRIKDKDGDINNFSSNFQEDIVNNHYKKNNNNLNGRKQKLPPNHTPNRSHVKKRKQDASMNKDPEIKSQRNDWFDWNEWNDWINDWVKIDG